jgi:hypothetical protein
LRVWRTIAAVDRGEALWLLSRRNGDEWRPTPREQAEQAVARAGALIARYFDAAKPDRRDLERARQELDEALGYSR